MANEQVGYLSIDSLGVRHNLEILLHKQLVYTPVVATMASQSWICSVMSTACGVHHIPSWSFCMVRQVESIATQRCMLAIC